MNKTYIVKHKQGAEVTRLIEARSRRVVEGIVLQDYEIEAVGQRNANEAMSLAASGIKLEKADE